MAVSYWTGTIWLPEAEDISGEIVVKCSLFLKGRNEDGSYEVEVDDNKMDTLDEYWGYAVWSLKPVEVQ